MFGGWTLADFKTCNLPQKVQSGFTAVTSDIVGADYQPVLYVGSQVVKGINHCVIAVQRAVVPNAAPKLVKFIFNEAPDNTYSLVSISGLAI